MTILSRYIARTYVKYWMLCMLTLVALIFVANLFGNLDNVFTSREALLAFLDKTVRGLPAMLDLLFPLTVLLATLFTFSSLSRTSELVAMQSAGMGLLRQLRPLLPVLAIIAVLDYGNQNYLHRMLQLEEQGTARSQSHQWTLHRDQIVYARGTQPQQRRVVDAVLFQWVSAPFRLARLERARHVERRPEGTWLLHDVVTRRHTENGWQLGQQPTLERSREQFPDLFQQDAVDAHHLPFPELSQKRRQLESLGRQVELYHLEWYQKTAALFAPFALVWFGTPLSQVFFRRGRASGEIMIGILGGLLFLIATEILFTLGRGGFLPPVLAAWSVNGVFVGLGGLLMWRLR